MIQVYITLNPHRRTYYYSTLSLKIWKVLARDKARLLSNHGVTTHPGIFYCQLSELDHHNQPDSRLSSRDQRCGKCPIDMVKRSAFIKIGNDQEESHTSELGYHQSPQGVFKTQ